jgi:carbamoyltransferase
MYILGISSFYHDSAACLISEGEVIAAAQEERFTRIKHDWRFPLNAVSYCLQEAGVTINDIGLIAFYEKPFLKFERVLETFVATAPRGMFAFLEAMPSWLKQKLRMRTIVSKDFGYSGKLLFAEHHMSHASSSFFLSPFEEAALLTIDGVGEWATASYGYGRGNRITLTHEMRFPDSLGLLYSTFTAYLGFKVNDAEYKVMGLAPYGKPAYQELIKKKLLKINNDGSIKLDLSYFSFQYGKRMFNKKFEALFGMPARKPESPLTDTHFDVAMSLQKVTEEVILYMARHVRRETGQKNLCLSGGVALNCIANARLLREGPFENIFIQPAAGDAGGAIGAAYLAYHHAAGLQERHKIGNLYLGPSYSNEKVKDFLIKNSVPFEELDTDTLISKTADLLSQGKVVGWSQGRMEFGPRALGNRSILADPRRPEMKDIVNSKIKFRETFRPFAPTVPSDDTLKYFDLELESPYMLLTAQVKTDSIPSCTHVDGSARVQTLRQEDNPRFYDLLKAFGRLSGVPVLLNTSLNLRSEPIACSPEDAYNCFSKSGMDCLVLENYLLSKK